MTAVSKPVDTPFFRFKFMVKPSRIKTQTLEFILSILQVKSCRSHVDCWLTISFDKHPPGTYHKERFSVDSRRVIMSNVCTDSVFVVSKSVPSHFIGVQFTFSMAAMVFRPCVILDHPTSMLKLQKADITLGMLNSPSFSDCLLLPSDVSWSKVACPIDLARPIYASRAILAQASPYFHAMFSRKWAESSTNNKYPVQFACAARIIIPCLIHMYSDWLPDRPPPTHIASIKDLLVAHACDFDQFGHDEWILPNHIAFTGWHKWRMRGC